MAFNRMESPPQSNKKVFGKKILLTGILVKKIAVSLTKESAVDVSSTTLHLQELL